MRKIIFTVSILIVTTVFIGCGQIQTNSPESLPEATVTPTPTPEPAEELPQESIEDTEEQEEETGNSEELFERQLNGVWGNLIGGCYFEQHEGKEITSGWFESDALPKAHITKIEEVAADKYKTTIEVDPWVDEDGEEYEGYSYETTYDGSIDGFKTCFVASTDKRDYLYIRLGDDMDEAWDYYCGSFVEDYKKLMEKHKDKLRELPIGKWYTENYDEENNWSGSYYIELRDDYTATCVGWRNKDMGSYDITGPGKVRITFSYCEYDDPAEGGWTALNGFEYSIDMEYDDNEATIKIDAPDVVSNLEDGKLYKR